MEERDSMVMYRSFVEAVRDLPAEQFKDAMLAILDYGLDETEKEDITGVSKIVLTMAKPMIDKNNQRYHNGRKGGRPKTKQDTVEKTEKPMVSNSETYGYDNEKPMVSDSKTYGYENENDSKPNVNEYVNDNVNDNAYVNVNDNDNDNDNDNVNDNAYANTEKVANATKERVPYQDVVEDFNDICKTLPRVTKLTDARRKVIKARFKDHGLAGIQTVFEKAESSDFLSGRNGGWSASFDWLMKPSNFQKVIEGNYDNEVKSKVKNIFDQIMEA